MNKKALMIVALLVFLGFIFAYYSNMTPSISIDCYLEYEKPSSNENPDKKYLAINIDSKIKDFHKYKSIDVDYTYDSLSNYIIGMSVFCNNYLVLSRVS